jgi:hypothetical protein
MGRRFKAGDRVRHYVHGDGTVMFLPDRIGGLSYTVQFDRSHPDLHDGELYDLPRFENHRCWFCKDSDLTLITDQTTCDRDRFEVAMAAMQGLLASGNTGGFENTAFRSVCYADALIAELQKPKQ